MLSILLLFCASCTITVPYESEEESLIESEQETTSESVEQEEAPDPTEIDYVYTPLDEAVKAEIEAYLGKTFSYSCYYGEHDGKHVFFIKSPLATAQDFQLGAFSLYCSSIPYLRVWDGEKLVTYADECDIFSFEASKEIAFIHLNHLINECWRGCAFKNNRETKRTDYMSRWAYMVGGTNIYPPRTMVYTGDYAMQGYCAEQEPLFSGDMGFLSCNLGVLPGETKERYSLFVTLENVVGYEEEKFSCYGSVADVLDMYQITEDMWLDSYEGASQSEGFDLEKAKSLKYCVQIYTADTINLNVEVCLALDYDKDHNSYILIMRIDEETGKKYVSEIYHYKWFKKS